MDIKAIIKAIAEEENISFIEASQKFDEWWDEAEYYIGNGWHCGFVYPTKLSSVGKSSRLLLILEDGSGIDGYYSSVCGYSYSPSFYTEDLIASKDVKYWKYKDE